MSSPSSSPSNGSAQPRWHEYPIGVGGELATAITRTLLPFLVGIGGCCAWPSGWRPRKVRSPPG